jgi:putative component of membrane protein insertase Oxa1/YidC/SpoIIIJ protein YidD
MRVVFQHQWHHFRPGAVADLPDGMARTLIRRQKCHNYVTGRADEVPPAKTSNPGPSKRKRGRPRKNPIVE